MSMATQIFENVTAYLDTGAPGVLNRKTGQVEFRAATPRVAPPPAAPPPRVAPPPPPTVEQRLANLAATIYSTPRAAAQQATEPTFPPHDRLSPGSIYEYRRAQIQKRDFAVDAPAQAGGGDLGRLAESVYRERARACGMC